VVLAAARFHPGRWRSAIRDHIAGGGDVVEAARILEEVGEQSDVAVLRALAKQSRGRQYVSDLGRHLARRVADRIYIEDQGRVLLAIGPRLVQGSDVRRKVLAILCFLLTRPDFAATRDQVLDALWPDVEPEIAVNSLNQTLYFLRRVFEPHYQEDLSPGYVHHDSEVIWLDPELVRSRSGETRAFLRHMNVPASPDEVSRLLNLYRDRFALDFEYEEWSSAHRESLHAAFLEVVERAIREDTATGQFDRAIVVARRALEIAPLAEGLELSLLRLYRVTGAHAAAAEQYSHYAASMRNDLGIEPPPLADL
jgi:DNA-binding SARP family transcriptional activator